MSDALDSLTDAALSEVFAVEVIASDDPQGYRRDFATSADAVLPFLECSEDYPEILRPWHGLTEDAVEAKRVWEVRFDSVWAIAPTLPRAICIALIRAKRAEKGGAK